MQKRKDYTGSSFRLTFLVIAILVVVMFIPPFSVGGVRFKRANILSDLVTFEDDENWADGGLRDLDMQFIEEKKAEEELPALDEIHRQIEDNILEGTLDINTGTESENGGERFGDLEMADLPDEADIVKFQDFTPEGSFSVSDFTALLGTATQNRVVRVAFLGDSYIEGDIITADIREQLQSRYSGHGIGFSPFGTPLAVGRATVKHNFNGWTNYNLINKKSTPERYREKYAVSGVLSIPSSGAWSSWEGNSFRKHIGSWSRARLLFVNSGKTTLEITVNDTIKHKFTPPSGDQLQQLNLMGAGMKKLRVKVTDPDGFIGYGAVLEGTKGISVDNYSIRSNSGLALFGTDSKTNIEMGRILKYDMIVLQYGLNAMDPNNTNYKAYGEQLRKVIEYVKRCFPSTAIVLLGVGDRSTQRDGRFVTMNAVPAMLAEQLAAAEECGIAFWSIFDAMGGHGSMAKFVEWNWAAKDYTHLSYRGGKHIATKFVEALEYTRLTTAQREPEPSGYEPPVISIDIDINNIYDIQSDMDSLVRSDDYFLDGSDGDNEAIDHWNYSVDAEDGRQENAATDSSTQSYSGSHGTATDGFGGSDTTGSGINEISNGRVGGTERGDRIIRDPADSAGRASIMDSGNNAGDADNGRNGTGNGEVRSGFSATANNSDSGNEENRISH